ncbi:MAG: hypothetical protein GXO18_01330 [Aquificae bacterium]|nr:hypothetical protein [Aquificota bacterium]
MEFILSFGVGFVSGIIYNEHLYRQSRRFPNSRVFLGSLIRLSFAGAVAVVILMRFGTKGVLAMILGFLVAKFIHVLLRGFLVVRYKGGGSEQLNKADK